MTQKSETVSLSQFFQRFPNEEAARGYFETNRWAGEVSCPHCGSLSVAAITSMKPMPYRCRDCRQHFSVRTGTVLAESRLPLHKWLMAIYMMTTARKGIPSTQMARELGITQKSAWFLAQRIRETWLAATDSDMGAETLTGFVKANVPVGASVVTDEASAYRGLTGQGYIHHTVNHSAGEYVRNYCIHTNGIESFWALPTRVEMLPALADDQAKFLF